MRQNSSETGHFSPSKSRSTGPRNRGKSKAKMIEEEMKPKEKKPPSKYVLEIIRMNFVDMIHRYDEH